MTKFAAFMIRFRIPILIGILAFSGLCLFLMPRVNINKDMTKYLSDSSNMKQGLDLMDKEFPDTEDEYYIRMLLRDVPSDKKNEIKKEIKDMANVSSISYKADDTEYNKDNYTLYEISTEYDYGTPEETALEKELADKYKDFNPVVENLSNEVSLAPYLIISVAVVLIVILFIMSGSWFEPVLILTVVGFSILVNMGTNFFLPSVSNTTHAIAAVLQLVLSLDYSVILMNRYRQKRAQNDDKISAMKDAFASAFPSILSSALTTFVGLLMLVFMQYRIGADLGIVLAKGVACSLLCIFTMLPAFIIFTDKIITKTKKPCPRIPMGWLATFSNKLKYVLPAAFAGLFVLFFFLQQLTPISFDGTPDRVIAKTFPENNRLVVLFNNKDADRITSLQDEIEKIPGVSSTASFQSTLDKKRDAEDMIDFLDDMDSEVDMDASDLRLMYYDYFKNGEAPSVKVADMFTFINDDLLPKEKYAKEMDEDIKKNIASMVKLSDRESLIRPRSYRDLSGYLRGLASEEEQNSDEMSVDDIRLMYMYYFSKQSDHIPGTMTLKEFVTFIQEDVVNDDTLSSYTDNSDFSEINKMEPFTDAAYITTPLDPASLAGALSMDPSQADMLVTLYYGLPVAGSYTMDINTLLDHLQGSVAADPQFAGMFSGDSLTQLSRASALTKLAASGQKLGADQMGAALGMTADQTAGIYMLYGMLNGTQDVSLTLPEFIDFLTGTVMTDPQYAAGMDAGAASALTDSLPLINAAATGTPLDYNSAAGLLGLEPSAMASIYALKAGSEAPDRRVSLMDMTDFLINTIAPDPAYGASFDAAAVSDLRRLSDIMHLSYENASLSYDEMANVLGNVNTDDLKSLFVLRDSKINPDFAKMSAHDFITFLEKEILPDPEMSKDIKDERRKDLHSMYVVTDAVVSQRAYDPDALYELFASVSDDAKKNELYLLTMLYGSMKDYDPQWKLSLLEMFDHVAENVVNDERFESVLEDDTVQDVKEYKKDLADAVGKLKGSEHSILLINTRLPYESDETYAFTDKVYELCDEKLTGDNYKIGSSAMYKEMQSSFGGEMLLITILTAASIFAIVAITFRNIMIPVLLVSIVLCGVFITVAFSGLRGVSINYLANIIVQCILMGACVDYGILFTGYYRDNRKKSNIRDSLKATYDGSIHTVLTSGLIMVVVTGIIGAISTDPAVGPICLTLSIGSASAILLILFVLPGMLAAFDKIILPKTKKKKEK